MVMSEMQAVVVVARIVLEPCETACVDPGKDEPAGVSGRGITVRQDSHENVADHARGC